MNRYLLQYRAINNDNNDLKNISHSKKYIFIHIPKTGGTTIEHLFFNKHHNNSVHYPIQYYSKYYDYFIFTFVRNPYTYVISLFNYYSNGGNQTYQDKQIIPEKIDINNLFNNKNLVSYFKIQYYYTQNSPHINTIYRFENFDESILDLSKRLDIELTEEKIHKRITPYTDYLLTPTFIDIISSLYDIDFVTFNYKKISISEPMLYSQFCLLLNS